MSVIREQCRNAVHRLGGYQRFQKNEAARIKEEMIRSGNIKGKFTKSYDECSSSEEWKTVHTIHLNQKMAEIWAELDEEKKKQYKEAAAAMPSKFRFLMFKFI